MNQSLHLLNRTAVKELILWVGTITIATLIITGVSFYNHTTSSKLRSLMDQAELTADEINKVLTIPLYNLDDAAAINSAEVYLSSGRLFGIRLISSATGLLVDTFIQEESMIPAITRDIVHNGMTLGRITLLFADTEIRTAQRDTLRIVSFLICGIVLVYAFTLHFIFSRILIRPLGRIIEGIRQYGSNNFSHKIDEVKYHDLNQLVLGLNTMAGNIDNSRRELLESQQKYSSIFNTSFVGILLCRIDGSIIDTNDTATRMFRAGSKQELLDKETVGSLLVAERLGKDFDTVWDRLVQSKDPGASHSWQARHLDTTTLFHVEIAIQPMTLSDSDYLVVNILDITARKEAEENLVQAQKMEALGVLAGGLAHDFNNVLGGITGHVSLLKYKLANKTLDDTILLSSLENIEQSAFRASSVINQLLTFSRKHITQLAIVDINEIITNVLSITEKSFDKSIDVQVNYHSEPALIRADAVQIEQVLLNLCVNAAHALTIMRGQGEAWGGRLMVSVKEVAAEWHFKRLHPEAHGEAYWCIQVLDTGVGIGRHELSKIYVPFYSTKSSSQGTGLGLAMVFNIIKEHHGFIEVHSEKDIGSAFDIFIPKHTEEEKEEASPSKVSEFIGEATVLLIDDDDTVRSTTTALLCACGLEVLSATNGADGIRLYRERCKDIHLVVLDMVMPKLSGKQTYIALKEINPDIKVVLVSGFGKDDRVQEMLDMGVDSFLQKPFTLNKLITAISSSLATDINLA